MAGSFTGPALGGVLADALGVRCDHIMLYHQLVDHSYAHEITLYGLRHGESQTHVGPK